MNVEAAVKEDDEEAPDPLFTHVNNILQSIFSNIAVYISNQQNYNSIGLFAHNSHISINLKGPSLKTRVLHCEEYHFAEFF